VKSYNSAQEFLDDKQLGSIDLLLLDVRMPDMDGFALQDHLSAAGFNIPIVFMTAHEVDRMQADVIQKGAVVFLRKPIEERDLLEAINNGLKE
jgi:FixJ family two-component response regulator